MVQTQAELCNICRILTKFPLELAGFNAENFEFHAIPQEFWSTVCNRILYTPVKSYVVKQPQEKWACDFHDDAPPLSFQLQVTEDFF